MDLLNNNNDRILLNTLKHNLKNCDEFILISAFVTLSGIQPLLQEFYELDKKGVKGLIITGDYLFFTEPKALKKLLTFKNITLKLNKQNLHVKGYFFKRENKWNSLIGSANLTENALKINNEWLVENENISVKFLNEIEMIEKSSEKLNKNKVNNYEEKYNNFKNKYSDLELDDCNQQHEKNIKFIPNLIQKEAIHKFQEFVEDGVDKCLLVSATGTGKTVTSAFITKKFKPKKMLFLVHREQILNAAINTFKSIIQDKKMEIFSINTSSMKNDFLFGTIQTISKDKNLQLFKKNEFDLIIVDEAHHVGAKSYSKILQYFKPKMLFGMTATPIRGDGINIYELFDYNICHDIGLYEALEQNLIAPFHYYGIEDLENDITFNNIDISNRIKEIIKYSRLYGYSGKNLHGLIFVSNLKEGILFEDNLNKNNVRSKFISSKDDFQVREKTISDLESGRIDYIITVDIFNEGIDIPFINQVILARPTKSAIVYIQQIGRGLRHSKNKEYLVILDFIKNYDTNFLIPIALSQDQTLNKNHLRKFILKGNNLLPGISTVNFTTIATETILNSIENVNFSDFKTIKNGYLDLKYKLGRIPLLRDFHQEKKLNSKILLGNKNSKSYFEIIEKIEGIKYNFNTQDKINLQYLHELSPGKRVHEWIILDELIRQKNQKIKISELNTKIETYLGVEKQEINTLNALKHLTREIFKSYSMYYKYKSVINIDKKEVFLTNEFQRSLENTNYLRFIEDLIFYNLENIKLEYKQSMKESLIVNKDYSKKEAYHYSNNDYSNGHQIAGYYKTENNEVLIFSTMNSTFTDYDNKQTINTIDYYSKSNRRLYRNNELTIEGEMAHNKYKMRLFVRNNQNDEFTYLGYCISKSHKQIKQNGKPAIKYVLKFKN